MADTLSEGQKLEKGGSLTSNNGAYTLTLQDDGNLVLAARGQAVWATGTNGQNAERLEVQKDGNCVLYTPDKPVWHTDTKGAKDVRLVLQDDRNVVLYAKDGPAWSSKTETAEPPPPAPEAEASARSRSRGRGSTGTGTGSRAGGRRTGCAAAPAPAARPADIHGGLWGHPVGDLGALLRRRQQVSGDRRRQRRLQPRPHSSGSGADDPVARLRWWPGPKGPGHHCFTGVH